VSEHEYILILAGGGGTRLWPQSRRRRPKQFLPLLPGGESLLAATIERLLPRWPIDRILVVTAADQIAEVRRVAPELPLANIVTEPRARNTAACIGLGAVTVLARDAEAACAVLPSDQHIADDAGFRRCLELAFVRARAATRPVVTIGVRPTTPETGFGYLEPGTPTADGARMVARFVEKPDRETAERYVAAGFLWNAGMFVFRASRMLEAIDKHLPALGALLDKIARDPNSAQTLAAGEVETVPGDFGWNDVGSFSALEHVAPHDAAGNATLGESVTIDARGNILVGDGRRVIAAVGVEDLIIVATDDAVLVLPKSRAQDVRRVVDELERTGRNSYL
jgi:mannose-1-phosphate guanylyltransferase